MSSVTFEMAYSMIFGSSMLGLIFGYLNYYSVKFLNYFKLNNFPQVISINVTSEGKPELKEYLLNEQDNEKDNAPRSQNIVETLTTIAGNIEEVK